jgi:hypothetical protein
VVLDKNSILTSTQSDKVVDLTDEVTMKLKEARLIK